MGVHPPCAMVNTSIAWYLGCSAPWTTTGTDSQVMDWFLLHRAPQGLTRWEMLEVPDTQAMVKLFGQQLPVVYLPVNTQLAASSPLIKAQDSH